MDKVDHLSNRVEPTVCMLPCFWALSIVLANTWSCPPARHHSTAIQKACPCMVRVGSILNEDAPAPSPFFYISMLFNYDHTVVYISALLSLIFWKCDNWYHILLANKITLPNYVLLLKYFLFCKKNNTVTLFCYLSAQQIPAGRPPSYRPTQLTF